MSRRVPPPPTRYGPPTNTVQAKAEPRPVPPPPTRFGVGGHTAIVQPKPTRSVHAPPPLAPLPLRGALPGGAHSPRMAIVQPKTPQTRFIPSIGPHGTIQRSREPNKENKGNNWFRPLKAFVNGPGHTVTSNPPDRGERVDSKDRDKVLYRFYWDNCFKQRDEARSFAVNLHADGNLGGCWVPGETGVAIKPSENPLRPSLQGRLKNWATGGCDKFGPLVLPDDLLFEKTSKQSDEDSDEDGGRGL
jgi:hypothetical protein